MSINYLIDQRHRISDCVSRMMFISTRVSKSRHISQSWPGMSSSPACITIDISAVVKGCVLTMEAGVASRVKATWLNVDTLAWDLVHLRKPKWFNCRWKLSNLLCLKYLGKTFRSKRPTSCTWKDAPSTDHDTIEASSFAKMQKSWCTNFGMFWFEIMLFWGQLKTGSMSERMSHSCFHCEYETILTSKVAVFTKQKEVR